MNHSTCLVTFDGQCLEAFECYAEILGGSIEVVDLQRPFPRLVQHALLRVGTAWIVCHGVRHRSPRLLAHAPDLTFDVLPLGRGLRDDGDAARQPLPIATSLSKGTEGRATA